MMGCWGCSITVTCEPDEIRTAYQAATTALARTLPLLASEHHIEKALVMARSHGGIYDLPSDEVEIRVEATSSGQLGITGDAARIINEVLLDILHGLGYQTTLVLEPARH